MIPIIPKKTLNDLFDRIDAQTNTIRKMREALVKITEVLKTHENMWQSEQLWAMVEIAKEALKAADMVGEERK